MTTLTILSNGFGQESAAISHLLVTDPAFRAKYAPGDIFSIHASTGDEHRATDAMRPHLERLGSMMTVEYEPVMVDLLASGGIEHITITPDMGFHGKDWETLQMFYDTHNTCGSKAFPKTCTDRLKLKPFYNYLEWFIGDRYGDAFADTKKRGLVRFAEQFGKIRILIGIARGEEKRIQDMEAKHVGKDGKEAFSLPLWRRLATEVVYPLIEEGLDRHDCHDVIRNVGGIIPFPSNCRRCPFMDEIELLWLWTFDRDTFRDWARQEQNKLDANQHMGEKNYGVWGKRTLWEKLEDAKAKYGHLTEAELFAHKFVHGHHVRSKY